MSANAQDEKGGTYQSGKRYLALRESKESRLYSVAFIRRRAGADSCLMAKRFVILLIKIRIRKGQKRTIKRNSEISIVKVQFFTAREIFRGLKIVTKCENSEVGGEFDLPLSPKWASGKSRISQVSATQGRQKKEA